MSQQKQQSTSPAPKDVKNQIPPPFSSQKRQQNKFSDTTSQHCRTYITHRIQSNTLPKYISIHAEYLQSSQGREMFRSVFSSKNIYKINENTTITLEKTLYRDHNLLRRYAFDGSHPKGASNASGCSNILITEFGYTNHHSKINIEPYINFGVFRSGSEFSRHDIESPNRENFENSATMQRDFESKIDLNQSTKQIKRQTSFKSNSNSSSNAAIQGFATQPNSGNVIKKFSGG